MQSFEVADKSSLVRQLKDVVKELCERSDALASKRDDQSTQPRSAIIASDELIHTIRKISNKLSMPPSLTGSMAHDVKIIGTKLWNKVIELSRTQETKERHGEWLAKLKHAACDLMVLGWTEDTIKRNFELLKAYTKAGKEWSDVGNYVMAENCYQAALQFASKVMNCSSELALISETEDFKRKQALVMLAAYRIETAWLAGDKKQARIVAQQCKDLLLDAPYEVSLVTPLCYKFAVELYESKQFQEAIEWLNMCLHSYGQVKDTEKQCITLRLLATIYMELSIFESALVSINMANELSVTPAGLYVQTKVYLLSQREAEAEKGMLEMIRLSTTPVKLALSACQLFIDAKQFDIASKGFEAILATKCSDVADLARVRFRYFEFLLSTGHLAEASALLKTTIEEHVSQTNRLPAAEAQQFHYSVFHKGTSCYKERQFSRSLEWFQIALKLVPQDDSVNRAKVLRFICRCHIELNQLDEALIAAMDADQLDPKSAHTRLLLFRIYASRNDKENAVQQLNKLQHDEDFNPDMYAMCAHDAFRVNSVDCTIAALESHLMVSIDAPLADHLVVIRNLIQLSIGGIDKDDSLNHSTKIGQAIKYLDVVVQRLRRAAQKELHVHQKELEWLFSTAWNIGLRVTKKEDFQISYEVFKVATELSKFCHPTIPMLDAQKITLLIRIYSLLELAEKIDDTEEERKALYLKTSLGEIEECKRLCAKIIEAKKRDVMLRMDKEIAASMSSSGAAPMDIDQKERSSPFLQSALGGGLQPKFDKLKAVGEDKILPLLCVAEFRAKFMLQLPGTALRQVIEESSRLEGIPPNAFEMMASICHNHPNHEYAEVTRDALEKCIRSTLSPSNNNSNNNKIDYAKCAPLFRRLIQLSSTRDFSLKYYEQILEASKRNVFFPPAELKWLVTDSWNNGVYYYKLCKYDKAEKWMSIAVMLCNQLPQGDDLAAIVMRSYEVGLEKFKTPQHQQQQQQQQHQMLQREIIGLHGHENDNNIHRGDHYTTTTTTPSTTGGGLSQQQQQQQQQQSQQGEHYQQPSLSQQSSQYIALQ